MLRRTANRDGCFQVYYGCRMPKTFPCPGFHLWGTQGSPSGYASLSVHMGRVVSARCGSPRKNTHVGTTDRWVGRAPHPSAGLPRQDNFWEESRQMPSNDPERSQRFLFHYSLAWARCLRPILKHLALPVAVSHCILHCKYLVTM